MKVKPVEAPQTEVIAPESSDESKPVDQFVVTEHEDGSVSFPLSDDTVVRLRDALVDDLAKVEQFSLKNPGNTLAAFYLISLLCVRWGEADGISLDALKAKPIRKFGRDIKRLNKAIEFFRLGDLGE